MTRKLRSQVAFAPATVKRDGFDGVALITGGVEALGHGVFVDETTCRQVAEQLVGKSLPAYLTHDGLMKGDRLTTEIGLFSGIHLSEGKVIAKNFRFLDTFKKYAPDKCEILLELAQKIPDQFGLSIVFEGYGAWVKQDGTEISDMSAPMPDDAVRPMPSIRVSKVESADFVKNPAANPDGLAAFMALREGQIMTSEPKQEAPAMILLSEHETQLSSLKAELTAAGERHLSELAQLKAEHEQALAGKQAEMTKLAEEHKSALAELTEKLTKAEAMSADRIGIQPIPVFAAPAEAKTFVRLSDKDFWEQYAKLLETDPASAAALKKAHGK